MLHVTHLAFLAFLRLMGCTKFPVAFFKQRGVNTENWLLFLWRTWWFLRTWSCTVLSNHSQKSDQPCKGAQQFLEVTLFLSPWMCRTAECFYYLKWYLCKIRLSTWFCGTFLYSEAPQIPVQTPPSNPVPCTPQTRAVSNLAVGQIPQWKECITKRMLGITKSLANTARAPHRSAFIISNTENGSVFMFVIHMYSRKERSGVCICVYYFHDLK